ncbi:hypothetical protein AAHA92_00778 [Salvia divinorum]|uniref:Transmembrane protein n=1 Tax=Salvia divinorum TaxID=28513 RepID=A0ABD1IN36_SALDI
MAIHTKNIVFVVVYTFVLLLDHHFGHVLAHHPHKIRPPAPVQTLIKSGNPPPTQDLVKSKHRPIARVSVRSRSLVAARVLVKSNPRWVARTIDKANAIMIDSRIINRYKKIQTDAYRPTTPGNSPGMGHDVPPRG